MHSSPLALGSRPVPAGHRLYVSAEFHLTLSYANRPGEPARTEALQILYPWEPQAATGSYTMHTWLASRMDVPLRQLERGAPGERDLRLSVAFAPDEPVYLEVLGADKAARAQALGQGGMGRQTGGFHRHPGGIKAE